MKPPDDSIYERAIHEQIQFLVGELERIRSERLAAQLAQDDESPIGWALQDPQFRAWLLKRQLERQS